MRAAGAARARNLQDARLSHELGDGSRRRRDQTGATFDRPAGNHRLPRRLPRTHVWRLEPHRQQGGAAARLRAVPARSASRPLRLSLSLRVLPRRISVHHALRVVDRGRAVHEEGAARECGGDFRRADPGRGRLCRAAARISQSAARAVRPVRYRARVRRSPVRGRTHRQDVGVRARGHRARRPAFRERPRQRHADRRDHRERVGDEVEARRARHHVRRQPGVLRRGARDARHRPEGAAAEDPADRRAIDGGRAAPGGEAWADRGRARAGSDGGHRVREGSRHARTGARSSARARRPRLQEGLATPRCGEEHPPARAAARRGQLRRGYRPPDHRRVSERNVGLASKVMSLKDAVARFVHDGDTLVIEGFTHLISFAAGHEIIRQRRRELTLCRLTPDLIYDQMIAAGCARKLVFSWAGNPGVGSLHALRRAVEASGGGGRGGRPLEIEEYSHFGMVARFAAGAARLPFWPLRDYAGTDLPSANPRIRSVTCPYTGEALATVPALNPDVTIVHAQRADAQGDAQIWGLVGVQKEAAFASRRVIVVVEELVDEAVIRSDPHRTLLPGMIVYALVVEPWGAHPSYAQGDSH